MISRNVDVGQTVAASMQAPTLFVLAADLTKMQVVANLDESDVGRIRPGQIVTFRVDAYPNETFRGTVSQVRLQPIVQQNVVTYATVIDVPNNELKLKPGMTANVNVEIARRTQRPARAERGAAIPADERDVRGARPDAAGPGAAACRRRQAAAAGQRHGGSGRAAAADRLSRQPAHQRAAPAADADRTADSDAHQEPRRRRPTRRAAAAAKAARATPRPRRHGGGTRRIQRRRWSRRRRRGGGDRIRGADCRT